MDIPASISLRTALALGLGAAKATDLARQILFDIGIDQVPPQPKQVFATALAAAGALLVESGARRQALTACAAAGFAGLVHSFERTLRAHGDLEKLQILEFMSQHPRPRK